MASMKFDDVHEWRGGEDLEVSGFVSYFKALSRHSHE
jgi:hypothetical protein